MQEVKYFERAISLPFSLQKQDSDAHNIDITTYDILFETESKLKTKEDNHNRIILDNVCCSRSVEQQCSESLLNLLQRKAKDPYHILNSLTSQQIRRLISTSYNVCFKRNSEEKIETASKKSQSSSKSSKSQQKKKRKKAAMNVLVQRLTQPTQSSLMKKSKEVSTKRCVCMVWCCGVKFDYFSGGACSTR